MKRTSLYRPDSPPASAVNARPNPAPPDTGAAGNGDDNTAEQIHHQAAALEAGQIDPMPFPGPYAYDLLRVVADPPGQAGGLPPLIRAAKRGDLEQLRMLLAQPGTNVNQVDVQSGATALFLAAEAGHPDIVELLLARGADVNFKHAVTGSTARGRRPFQASWTWWMHCSGAPAFCLIKATMPARQRLSGLHLEAMPLSSNGCSRPAQTVRGLMQLVEAPSAMRWIMDTSTLLNAC